MFNVQSVPKGGFKKSKIIRAYCRDRSRDASNSAAMQPKLSHLRLLGYVTTIVLHLGNSIWLIKGHAAAVGDVDLKYFRHFQYRYFTVWTFAIQIFHAFLGVICEILIWKNLKTVNYSLPKHLRRARDTIFASIVVPTTFLVSTFFWTIFIYDRELIYPAFIDRVLSTLNNHIMHTFIVLPATWEMVTQPRNQPRSHRRYIAHLGFHIFVYIFVMVYSYIETGEWIYPLYGKLYGTIYFYLLIVLQLISALLFYHMQWAFTRLPVSDRPYSRGGVCRPGPGLREPYRTYPQAHDLHVK
ncbi:Androgen-dependent TFPI-regulating protein [Eumeta japonica]|uniref:Androgen-dependent TFPI-regulating protein n=1 Tax=Eumeta variegata TaxID=151549 RepID=A0A4C1XKG8_EUMVA|nr:Androgen-dependent TFPI-regulating protein [Eumeta japonica]